MDEFSKCTKNLESLFVQITNKTAPWYVGVVYRPPSGSKSEAIAELENLMQCLPNKKVIILGDFNDDLLKPDSQKFESVIYGNNIYVFSLQVSETQTYYAGGLQTPSKSILTLLPGYIALKINNIRN